MSAQKTYKRHDPKLADTARRAMLDILMSTTKLDLKLFRKAFNQLVLDAKRRRDTGRGLASMKAVDRFEEHLKRKVR